MVDAEKGDRSSRDKEWLPMSECMAGYVFRRVFQMEVCDHMFLVEWVNFGCYQ